MICKRIIPTILIKNGMVVKDRHWNPSRVIGTIPQIVSLYNEREADELVVFNLDEYNSEIVKEISDNNFVPLTIGGGIDSVEKAVDAIRNGADKVAITYKHSIETPLLLEDISNEIGIQSTSCVINKKCYQRVIDVISKYSGEIIVQSKEHEGKMNGYHTWIPLTNRNVIISSGCSGKENVYRFILFVEACAIGALFAFTEHTPKTIKKYLKDRGVNVRWTSQDPAEQKTKD